MVPQSIEFGSVCNLSRALQTNDFNPVEDNPEVSCSNIDDSAAVRSLVLELRNVGTCGKGFGAGAAKGDAAHLAVAVARDEH